MFFNSFKNKTIKLLIIGIFFSNLIQGCETTSTTKLDPEEKGYCNELCDNIESTVSHIKSFYQAVQDIKTSEKLGETTKLKTAKNTLNTEWKNLKKDANSNLPKLDIILPPNSFKNIHENWQSLLTFFKEDDLENLDSLSIEELENGADHFLEFNKEWQDLNKEFDARPSRKINPDQQIAIEFCPIMVPVCVDTNGNFKLNLDVKTPFGTIGYTSSESGGIKTLIVKQGEQIRYLALNQKFQFFIPKNCGIVVEGNGADTITLIVDDCSGKSSPSTSSTNSEFQNPAQNNISNVNMSAEDFIKYYYEDLINSGNYDEAWSHLSKRFQDKAGSYSEYTSFWSKIDKVNVKSVSLIQSFDNSAEVSVSLQFINNNGNVTNQTVGYILTWDSDQQKWLFVKGIK